MLSNTVCQQMFTIQDVSECCPIQDVAPTSNMQWTLLTFCADQPVSSPSVGKMNMGASR